MLPILRFAPSPTGPLHLGGLRMALYNQLYARRHGGKWILRIEDTDATRFVPGSVEGIRQALDWAGLEYDYGPGKDDKYGPYYQSERLDLYRTYAKKLVDKGHAYRCFCSPDKLSSIRERLARLGSNNSYDKSCLHLSDEEVARKVKAGEKYTVRINDSNPPNRPPTHDLVFGLVKDAHLSLATDPILLKSDGFPTYHLASVVDDYTMNITHVLRGEEWLPSLPLHLDLYAHLDIKPPEFAHLPLLLNSDGSKMSKRNGDVRVIDYIKRGWEPTALLNWLALAGWGTSSFHDAPDSTRPMSIQELESEFDLTALTQRNSSLDPAKLEYLNKWHLGTKIHNDAQGSLKELAERIHDNVKSQFPVSQYTTIENIMSAIQILDRRLVTIIDVPVLAPYLFIEPDYSTAEAADMLQRVSGDLSRILNSALGVVRHLVDSNQWESTPGTHMLALLNAERDNLGLTGKEKKKYMMALRWALTGMKDGPAIVDIIKVLGHERTLERLRVPGQKEAS
ncbi:glutamyl-trna synthetase [Moniliophthora roreri]|nr:glutamyl-trna synthetase [Moniliophthora roreri]